MTLARDLARAIAQHAPELVGSWWSFVGMCVATLVWIAVGPLVGFSDAWLLVPSAIASIAALLLVVLLQYSQNRDTRVIQLKLDEVIRSLDQGRTELVRLEQSTDEQLVEIEEEFRELREQAELDESPERA